MNPNSNFRLPVSDLMSRKEAALYLGVSERTLAIWKCTGRYKLPVVKIGRLAKYRRADLDAFIASRVC
ncbi:helix-turn-helix domain-containing protein [Candidatus Obscuribacterales bacterium]|nr:helix-turn-helix domain-containing protein [Candidatus Obscuribacterales bacterium]